MNAASELSDSSAQVLGDVLACIKSISHHLGWVGPAFYHESLISPVVSSEEILSQLVKFLNTGFGPASPASLVTIFGSDAYLAKRQSAHKNQRTFMVEILFSLHTLHSRATSWKGVLEVIEKYLQYLSLQRFNTGSIEFKSGYGLNCSLMVQVTSQVARKMFEAAFNILLLLAYLVETSGQVHNFFSSRILYFDDMKYFNIFH